MDNLKIILAAGLIGIGLAGTARAETLKVVATTTDLAWITEEVGGDKVEVQSIAKGYQDPHFVDPKPSFLFVLRNADLLEVVGMDLEISWLPPLLDQSRNPKINPGGSGYFDLSAGVEILDRPTGTVNRSMGDVHAMGNPHYWLDPANAIRIGAQIRNRLSSIQPENAEYFTKRYESYKAQLNEAHQRWKKALAPYKGAKIVTYHRSWTNFVGRYGIDVVDFIEPKPGVPPSPSHLFQLTKKMKAEGVKVIAIEPYFDLKTPESVAEKVGARVVVLYPSIEGKAGLDSYFDVFDHNVRVLVEALR